MRGKWIVVMTVILFFTVPLMASCGSQDFERNNTRQSEDLGKETEELADIQETQADIREAAEQHLLEDDSESELDEAYEMILNNCTRELIGGYLVDDSFLLWFANVFGEDKLLALAEYAAKGEQDPDIWYEISGNSIHVLFNMYSEATGFQSYSLKNVRWKDCADSDKIVMNFTGDINFAENWPTTMFMDSQENGLYDCLSGPLLEEMNAADIMMINNEFTYSTRGEPLEGKDFTFRANPERVSLLDIMGVDIVGVANNHTYDYGEDALVDTLDTLDGAEVPYVGAGRNLSEAMEPKYFIANGRKIAIVAATQIERSTNFTKEATEETPGVLKTLKSDKFLTVIEEARKKADYVIVFVHWGTEGTNHYGSDQVNLGQAFIDAGANAVIGGHTHCLQGFEYYQGVPIIYSLGNFWFSSSRVDTGISQMVIHSDGTMDFRFLPCVQKNKKTYLVEEPEEKQRILDFMESISSGVSIDEAGYVTPLE